MTLKALLFDVDGTLADTEPHGHLPAYNRAFKDLGLDWTWSKRLYRNLLLQPGGRERIDYYLNEHSPNLGEHKERIEKDRSGWIESLHALKSKYFKRRLAAGRVPLRPGVQRLMAEAVSRDIKLALVTNASRSSLDAFLDHSLGEDLRNRIEVIVQSAEVARKKPAPDLYLVACERLGLAPADCLALEDSRIGLEAACAAGVPAVVTVNADTRHQDFSEALLVVNKLGEPDACCKRLGGTGRDDQFEYVDIDLLCGLHDAAGRSAPPAA